LASGYELQGCFAKFTLAELRRFFSRDCGIRMTGEGLKMTGELAQHDTQIGWVIWSVSDQEQASLEQRG
jgi:hypothetical protein